MMKFNQKVTKKGFTLIEMLVVISLIGILAALALVSFSSVQKQARDTTRKSDLKQYQTALESYANFTGGLFPEYNGTRVASTTLCSSLNTKLEPDIVCAEDPKSVTNGTYSYLSQPAVANGTSTATGYVIWAKEENKSVDTYWYVCSNGKNGESLSVPTISVCSS